MIRFAFSIVLLLNGILSITDAAHIAIADDGKNRSVPTTGQMHRLDKGGSESSAKGKDGHGNQ